jgi:hypothetical protein
MPSTTSEAEEKEKVLSLVLAVPNAIDHKDAKKILSIYDTTNPKFSTFEDDPSYLERVDGARFRKFIGELANLEASSIDRKDVRIDFLARNVAVVTGIDDWTSRRGGKAIGGRSRFTIILLKGRSWKIIHEHFTKIK